MSSSANDNIQVAKELALFLEDKKAENIIALDVSLQSQFADAFIILSGQSLLHLHGLQSYIIDFLAPKGYKKKNPHNSYLDSPWVLLDMGDIIIHLFTEEAREFYRLEKLWFDAPIIFPEK